MRISRWCRTLPSLLNRRESETGRVAWRGVDPEIMFIRKGVPMSTANGSLKLNSYVGHLGVLLTEESSEKGTH